MNLPQIMQESIQALNNCIGDLDQLAVANMLNSKLANMVSQTGLKFRQYAKAFPTVISYYAICFLPSGSSKDRMVDLTNDYLIPFVEKRLEKEVENFKIDYETEQTYLRPKEKDEIKKELKQIRTANLELTSLNFTGLYREAEQISKIGFGSLFIRNGEIGDFLEDIVKGNASKRELLSKLKDVYEGTFAPSVIASDGQRQTIKGVAIQLFLYSDFAKLLNPSIKKCFCESLKSGFARRSFIYMPTKKYKASYPKNQRVVNEAITQMVVLQKKYAEIFDKLLYRENKVLDFSVEAQDALYDYHCQCVDFFNESNKDIIVKIEVKESFWKITKLSAMYYALEHPTGRMITQKYVDMAIEFYKAISPSLEVVINEREKTVVEQFAEYFYNHREENITRSMLSKNGIIKRNFKKEFDSILDEIKDELMETYKCRLYDYEGGEGNTKAYQVVEI